MVPHVVFIELFLFKRLPQLVLYLPIYINLTRTDWRMGFVSRHQYKVVGYL